MIDAIEFRAPTSPPPRLALRPHEAAAALGICTKTLRKLPIPTTIIGRAKLYSVAELTRWLAENSTKAETRP